jgi:hypothetical protein
MTVFARSLVTLLRDFFAESSGFTLTRHTSSGHRLNLRGNTAYVVLREAFIMVFPIFPALSGIFWFQPLGNFNTSTASSTAKSASPS